MAAVAVVAAGTSSAQPTQGNRIDRSTVARIAATAIRAVSAVGLLDNRKQDWEYLGTRLVSDDNWLASFEVLRCVNKDRVHRCRSSKRASLTLTQTKKGVQVTGVSASVSAALERQIVGYRQNTRQLSPDASHWEFSAPVRTLAGEYVMSTATWVGPIPAPGQGGKCALAVGSSKDVAGGVGPGPTAVAAGTVLDLDAPWTEAERSGTLVAFSAVEVPSPDSRTGAIVCEPWFGDGWQPVGDVGLINVDLDPLQRSAEEPPPRIQPSANSTVYVSVILRWAGQEFRGAYSKCTAGTVGFPNSGTIYLDSPKGPLDPRGFITQVVVIPIQNVNTLAMSPLTRTVPVSCRLVSSVEFEQWSAPVVSGGGPGS